MDLIEMESSDVRFVVETAWEPYPLLLILGVLIFVDCSSTRESNVREEVSGFTGFGGAWAQMHVI